MIHEEISNLLKFGATKKILSIDQLHLSKWEES